MPECISRPTRTQSNRKLSCIFLINHRASTPKVIESLKPFQHHFSRVNIGTGLCYKKDIHHHDSKNLQRSNRNRWKHTVTFSMHRVHRMSRPYYASPVQNFSVFYGPLLLRMSTG
eukprot:CCRYP_012688-RA/>CCRYP_012688-RA protein AED:0.41 eAED:0.41 QI:93/1/1/1/0/0/2/383/114